MGEIEAESQGEPPVPPPPGVGQVVAGKYRIERVLGRGGMGVVVEASHLHLEQSVAIKFLLPEASSFPGAVARFVREARAMARIRSEHVARVLDVDVLPSGGPFLVMEHLVGTDLHQVLRARGPLPAAEAVDWLLQACEALAEAHALGIVHRDLKPSNLFLTRRLDGSPLVKLLDFGIAKAPHAQWASSELTVTRGMLGSPLYMSPEQLRDTSSVDARSDLWSLGVILHELLTARFPFEAPSQASLGAMIVTSAPTALRTHFADAPEGLEQVILRCLEKDPERRFPNVGAFADALRPFAEGRSRASFDRIASVATLLPSNETVLAVPRTNRPPAPAPVSSRAASGAFPTVPISTARHDPPSSQLRSGVRSPTDNFRRQHEELLAMGGEIFPLLDGPPETLAQKASEVRRKTARFAGKLAVHASMENEALYPRLLAHRDDGVRAKAKSLFDEVKGIYDAFGHYSKRWPSAASIEADPAGFARETRRILKTLWMRMMRENEELYPLVDAAG